MSQSIEETEIALDWLSTATLKLAKKDVEQGIAKYSRTTLPFRDRIVDDGKQLLHMIDVALKDRRK